MSFDNIRHYGKICINCFIIGPIQKAHLGEWSIKVFVFIYLYLSVAEILIPEFAAQEQENKCKHYKSHSRDFIPDLEFAANWIWLWSMTGLSVGGPENCISSTIIIYIHVK